MTPKFVGGIPFAAYKRAWREDHRKRGLCIWCTARVDKSLSVSLCPRHVLVRRENQAKALARRRG